MKVDVERSRSLRRGHQLTRRELLRDVGALGATAAGLALLSACQQPAPAIGDGTKPTAVPAAASPSPRKGGTFAVAMTSNPTDLVPFASGSYANRLLMYHAYEALVANDPATNDIAPALAESWEVSPDAKAITFKLRRGVKFHDGSDFTAEAVALNHERVRDPNSRYYDKVAGPGTNVSMGGIDRLEVLDPYTVRYVLKQPDAELPYKTNHWFQLSPEAIKRYPPAELGKHPIGTGPFRLERQEGRIGFERFDGHWRGAAYLDKLLYRVYPDPLGAEAALASGEVDMVQDLDVLAAARHADKFATQRWNIAITQTLWLNTRHPFTKDVRVRQALSLAVDRESIAKNLFKGQVTVPVALYSETNPAFDPSLKPYAYDPDRAKKLLAEAGFGAGVAVKALYPTNVGAIPLVAEVSQTIQSDLRKVGVNLSYDVLEFQAFLQHRAKGLTNDHIFFITGSGGELMSWLEQVFLGKSQSGPTAATWASGTWYENDEVQKLFDAARGQVDAVRRKQVYRQAEQILMRESPAIPIITYSLAAVYTRRLVGSSGRIFGIDFSKAWLTA